MSLGRIACRAGWLIDHAPINGYILSNRLLKAGVAVYWQEGETRAGRATLAPGALWIPASDAARPIVEAAVRDLGLNAYAAATSAEGPYVVSGVEMPETAYQGVLEMMPYFEAGKTAPAPVRRPACAADSGEI